MKKEELPRFIGVGWGFPPTFEKVQKTVILTEGAEDIQKSLEILLSTGLGERVMLPGYGSNLKDLLFEPIDTSLQTLLFDRIETAILFYEPRIEIEEILLHTDRVIEGIIIIEIVYRIRVNNSRFNFVFPFYKNEGADIPQPI